MIVPAGPINIKELESGTTYGIMDLKVKEM